MSNKIYGNAKTDLYLSGFLKAPGLLFQSMNFLWIDIVTSVVHMLRDRRRKRVHHGRGSFRFSLSQVLVPVLKGNEWLLQFSINARGVRSCKAAME